MNNISKRELIRNWYPIDKMGNIINLKIIWINTDKDEILTVQPDEIHTHTQCGNSIRVH